MTLVNARAAFEKAVTDAVAAADNTVEMVYDNVHYTTPGKSTKYILMSLNLLNQHNRIREHRQIIMLV